MPLPLWQMLPKAIRWFNYQYSLPRVAWESMKIFAGLTRYGEDSLPLIMTTSISEDYARLWLYFAQKHLRAQEWQFLIVDSAGDMDVSKFKGCQVIRFLNVYHGQKVDLLLRKLITSNTVFLCDDDRYLVSEISEYFQYLEDTDTPIVSLAPRNWWTFSIDGQEFLPMGSYALLFKRHVLLEHQLKFQSPANLVSPYKVFPENVKPQPAYDTADYMNEQLLLKKKRIVTVPNYQGLLGFDGLSGRRILLLKYGKKMVKQAILESAHLKDRSINGETVRTLYGIVKFERLYHYIFQEPPRFCSKFSEDELLELVEKHPTASLSEKEQFRQYTTVTEEIYQLLIKAAAMHHNA